MPSEVGWVRSMLPCCLQRKSDKLCSVAGRRLFNLRIGLNSGTNGTTMYGPIEHGARFE